MRYTLLEMTQSILRSMESDEVSSIHETQEARDVVDIIKECFFDIVGSMDLASNEGPFKLDSSGDNTKPTLMYLPTSVINIEWLKYNIGPLAYPEYVTMRYVTNEEFVTYQSSWSQAESGTMSIPINGVNFPLKFKSDRMPSYYTVFDEKFVIFDSYDSSTDSTLMSARTLGWGNILPEFKLEDDFVPDLDPRQFQLLLQDAKSTAHVELKQAPNPKAEQKYRKNQILAQRTRTDNDPYTTRQRHYRFGRKR